MCLDYFLDILALLFKQPGISRRPVDWCRNWMSVLYVCIYVCMHACMYVCMYEYLPLFLFYFPQKGRENNVSVFSLQKMVVNIKSILFFSPQKRFWKRKALYFPTLKTVAKIEVFFFFSPEKKTVLKINALSDLVHRRQAIYLTKQFSQNMTNFIYFTWIILDTNSI